MFKNLIMAIDSLAEAINRNTIEAKKHTELMREQTENTQRANELAERTLRMTESAVQLAKEVQDTWSFDDECDED